MTQHIQAVVFDWAGTIIDYGSRAPVEVFCRVFEKVGVPITVDQAREPMGMSKREHIAAICQSKPVQHAWLKQFRTLPMEKDIDRLYAEFLPLQKMILAEYCDPIPGAQAALAYLASQQIQVGSTTGYTRELMSVVQPLAATGGVTPSVVVCADDVSAGRPKPWMIFEALQRLDRYPPRHCIVVDDTLVGIQAGIHAGCWTVALRKSGNELGMSLQEAEATQQDVLHSRLSTIEQRFAAIGADAIIDSVADIVPVFQAIEQWIADGKLPNAYR